MMLSYRPNEFDDWGQIRNADGSMFASVRRPLSEDELAIHRAAKTDPFEKLALMLIAAVHAASRVEDAHCGLPVIEQLDDMTDAQRADWLQKLPFSLLIKHQAEIAGAFDRLGFEAGIRCLETELALLASVRAADGVFRQEPLMAAHMARGEMRAAAKRGRDHG